MKRSIRRTLILTLVLLSSSIGLRSAESQIRDDSRGPMIVKADANACELNSAYMDQIRNELASGDGVVIIIARLGTGERSRQLSRRRLRTAFGYISYPTTRVVLAYGEPVNGDGRLEFYVRGELFLVTLAPRGKNICPTCCK
jgi:hypothetical protein